MNENIRLVIKLLFFNVGMPVLSVAPTSGGSNPDLTNVKLQSSVEFLSEYGDIVVRRTSSPQPVVLSVYEEPESLEDQWVYDFGMEGLASRGALSMGARKTKTILNDLPTAHKGASAPDKSILSEQPATITAAPGKLGVGDIATRMESEPIYKALHRNRGGDKIPTNKETAGEATAPGTGQNPPAAGVPELHSYNITLSKPNYLLFRLLRLFNARHASLSYEYTELDYIPLVLQILLHIPLILTGVIIFIVVMTLDPELNASLVKNEIEKLPSAKYTEDMELSSCPVCLDEFVADQEIRILGCRHSFHKECIDAWLIHTLKCPICRKGVSAMSDAPQFEMYQTYYYV